MPDTMPRALFRAAKMLDTAQDFIVIIRAIHDRGQMQQLALAELNARGLWLSAQQRAQAGI